MTVSEYNKGNRKNTRYGKRNGLLKSLLTALACLTAVFAVLITIVVTLALKDENMDKFNGVLSGDAVKSLAKAGLTGEEVTLTNQELNGIVATLLSERPAENKNADFKISALAFDFKNGQMCDVYAKVVYKGTQLSISAKAQIGLDTGGKRINLILSNCYLGMLPVSPKMITDRIISSEEYKTKLNKYITVTSSGVNVPSQYELTSEKIKINIISLKTADGKLSLRADSLLSNVPGIIEKYFS